MFVPVPWARTNTGIQYNNQLLLNNIVTVAHSVGYTYVKEMCRSSGIP